MHDVLVNGLGGVSLPGKSVARLTDHPNMTIDAYHGRRRTTATTHCRKYNFFPFCTLILIIFSNVTDFSPPEMKALRGTYRQVSLSIIVCQSICPSGAPVAQRAG